MTTKEILELAIKIERKAAAIYRLLHERFRGDEIGEFLFNAMARDEEWHAAFIETEMNMMKTFPNAFGEAGADSSALLETLSRMEALESFIRENPISIEKAVSTALEIEEDVVEKRYMEFLEIVSPSLKRIFSELIDMSISEHIERLESAARKLGLKKPIKTPRPNPALHRRPAGRV